MRRIMKMRKINALILAITVTMGLAGLPVNAEKVYPEDYHVTDEEWEKAKNEFKKQNNECTETELEQERAVYEYDQWSILYSEQIKTEGGQKYLYNYGEPEANVWFCDVDDGSKTPDWYRNHSRWVYSDENGKLYVDTWREIDGKWYHFDNDGYININWYKDKEDWYYLDPETGAMRSGGWFQSSDHFWYYLDNSGRMQTGWVYVKGAWYYMDETGHALLGSWLSYNGKWYLLGADYRMKTGWVEQGDGTWYYFDESGAMVTGDYSIDGKKYEFDVTGKWTK